MGFPDGAGLDVGGVQEPDELIAGAAELLFSMRKQLSQLVWSRRGLGMSEMPGRSAKASR